MSLAKELEDHFGVKSQLKKGGGGVFDVHVDGRLVFSKKQVGRFPEIGEVSGIVDAL